MCVALIGTVSACSPSSQGTQGASGKQETITIINWLNPAANEVIRKINAEFEAKYPNIKVDYRLATDTSTQYPTLLQTAVSSNTADIITTPTTFQPLPRNPTRENMTPYQLWATSGLLEPLDGQPWLNNFTKESLANETYNGKVYGVLSGQYQYMVFYDKAAFSKHNLTPPKTYDEFVRILETFKGSGVTPLWLTTGGSNSVGLQWYIMNPLLASMWLPKVGNGDLAGSLESGAAKWDNPESIEVLTRLAAVGKYLDPGYTGIPWQNMPGDFAARKAPMLLTGSYDLATVQKANPSMEVGSFPLPGSNNPADNVPVLNNDLTFSVLKGSTHKEAALKWLGFFAQPEIYKKYVDATGISPTQTGGSYDSFAAKVLGDYLGKGVNANKVFPTLSASQGFNTQSANFPTILVDLIAGKKSPAQVASTYAGSWKTSG